MALSRRRVSRNARLLAALSDWNLSILSGRREMKAPTILALAAVTLAVTLAATLAWPAAGQPAGGQTGGTSPATNPAAPMQQQPSGTGPGSAAATMMPKEFALNAAIANKFEVIEGLLALRQASDLKLKDYAQLMIKEHTAALEELQA